MGATPSEANGVGPYPAPNLQDLVLIPTFKFCTFFDLGFDEVSALFNFVKVITAAHLQMRMSDVARPTVLELLGGTG